MWRNSFRLIVKLLKSITDRLGMDGTFGSELPPLEDEGPLESGVVDLDSIESFTWIVTGFRKKGLNEGFCVIHGSISKINRLARR